MRARGPGPVSRNQLHETLTTPNLAIDWNHAITNSLELRTTADARPGTVTAAGPRTQLPAAQSTN